MSRRMSQPCDVYDISSCTNRHCSCLNCNSINNYQYRSCNGCCCSCCCQRNFTTLRNKSQIKVCVPDNCTTTTCQNMQICKPFNTTVHDDCNNIRNNTLAYNCETKSLKSYIKKYYEDIPKTICMLLNEDRCTSSSTTIETHCCNPVTYCCTDGKYLKSAGFVVILSLIFFAWLINKYFTNCTPRCHYRFWK